MHDDELVYNINKLFNPCRKRTKSTVARYRINILKIRRPVVSELTNIGRFTWIKDDEEFLKNNFYNMSQSEIADCLGKTESSIKNKVRRLGLRSVNSKGIKWTTPKIVFLKDNFDKLPINKIVFELQIPIEKILAKAIELNLVYEVKQLTDPEIFIKNQLEKLNVEFEYQKNIYCKKGTPYRIDFISNNKIIEVQGDYYHCNPNHI